MAKNIKLVSDRPSRDFVPTLVDNRTLYVRRGFRLVRCHGQAHSNPHIDHCMGCLSGAWGWAVGPAPTVTDVPLHDRVRADFYKCRLPYGSGKPEDRQVREAYREEQRRLEAQFKVDVLAYLGLLDNPKADILYAKAWEMGHASGYSEVLNYAEDLAELVK